ncbi:uncharacterized protein [Panulirus ornatus]|uniref:uncharacterized protein isoform X2 n=1 Tax=Panulirus ornatus TaxID=150431 RepID=UPI003A8A5354
MSATNPGHTPKEPSTVAADSGSAGAWQTPTPADPTRESLRAVGADLLESYYDSLEEESSQSLTDSLNGRKHSSAGAGDPAHPHNSFSDSLKDSGDESDVSDTLDSDTGSFYSVQSYRPTGVSDSVASLLNSEFHSESTLYDSAPSIHTPIASSRSSFLSLDGSIREGSPNTFRHRSSLSFQPGHPEHSGVRRDSELSWEYTSCPDLSPAGYHPGKEGLLQTSPIPSLALTSQPISNSFCGRRSPRLSLISNRSVNSASMSAVAGSASPKQNEEVDKKKKGLMSSFRKSRKTGRKLRQQKKAEGDVASISSGATLDGDQDLMFDSDLSAPNSPALLKSEIMDVFQGGKKSGESGTLLDSHQATHERLNGSASPKGSSPKGSATSSKTPSPVLAKSGKTEDAPKETEEKEEKKKEKSKFGSLLMRKDKKHKVESASKSSIMSNASLSSSVTTDDSIVSGNAAAASDSSGVTTDEKGDGGKDDSDSLTAAAGPASTEDSTPRSTASQSPSFRSYISNVQFVKNFTVNAEAPQVKSAGEAIPKAYVPAPGKDSVDGKTTPEETTATVETRKTTTVSSSGKPTTTETIASTDKREHLYKILVIGELGTGKTSIIKRYVHQFFSQHYRATIGVDFALKVLNWDNNTVIRLQLWDIAGQERFGNMTRVYYKEAVGAFVVFDVTRAQTFDAVTKWKTDLDTKVTLADGSPIPAVLLANKCDQPKEGVVNNPARMDDYCRERGFSGWFETSAKENINIDEASRFLVNKILSNEKQGMMMTESMDTDKFSVDGKANPVDRSGCRC